MKNQRKIALEILLSQEKNNLLLKDILLNYEKELSSQEYGFIRTIVYGTVRYKLYLDYIIKKISKIKIGKIHLPILMILRLSLYQLIFMGHVKDSAIINEGVELTKTYGNKGSVSYVNGVLRNFLRNKEELINIHLSGIEKLSIKYSIPKWIIETLSIRTDNMEEILDNFNNESTFAIRYAAINTEKDELEDSLKMKGFILSEGKLSSSAINVENPTGIFDTEEYKSGKFYVQSDASQYVSLVGNIEENINILDLCAAPGGKSSHMYELTNGNSNITACDITNEKIDLLKENFSRLGYKIKIEKNDGTKFNPKYLNSFDFILVDAPCSSLGLIKKFPELKYNKTSLDLVNLSKKQLKILENAYEYLVDNGTIVYSTCTFTKIENEDVINEFILRHDDIIIEKIDGKETYYVDPVKYNTDSFCITIMRKVSKCF